MIRCVRPALLAVIIVQALCAGVPAQERLRLKRADLLENEVVNGETVRILSGNVVLEQGDVTLYSDRVANYSIRENWVFEGNVKVVDPGKELLADYIRYSVRGNRFFLRGNLRLERGAGILLADRAIYYPDRNFYSCAGNVQYVTDTESIRADSADFLEPEELVEAYGNVRYRNEKDNVRLNGQFGRFKSEDRYGMVTGNPSISFSDSASAEITWIYGEIMEYFGDERNLRIRTNVRVNRGILSAVADTAWYYRESESARLIGNPRIYDKGKTITADAVVLSFEENAIRRLEAEGSACATMAPDSGSDSGRVNELKGSTITIDFAGDDINSMKAERNAVCRYYVSDSGKNQGANVVSGSAITILFKAGAINSVIVEGGSEGEYYPPALIDLIDREKKRGER